MKIIKLNQIGEVIAERFKDKKVITCYVSSNAATPTACFEALTESIKAGTPKLPFMRMIHLLLLGPIPHIAAGLQDRIMAYSTFSGSEIRKAVNEGRAYYLPCTLANAESLIGKGREYEPDIIIMKVCQNSYTGEYNLGLSVEAMHTAIDYAKVVIAEFDNSMPPTCGETTIDASSIDYLIIDDNIKPIHTFPVPDFNNLPNNFKRIGELIAKYFIRDGVTLQIGIGDIPNAVVSLISKAGYRDLGIQTEVYSDGLMLLQKEGIVTNRKKKIDMGHSATSLLIGSKDLYEYSRMRTGIQLYSCFHTNSADVIRANSPFVAVNSAMGVDLFGNVWADSIDVFKHWSGVGGQPDFVRALNDPKYGVPIIAISSVTHKGEPKIVKAHPAGVNLTASGYDNIVVVTEYGIADLRGLTLGEKALALANIAHPKFSDEYFKYIYSNPVLSRPLNKPKGLILYKGSTKLDE